MSEPSFSDITINFSITKNKLPLLGANICGTPLSVFFIISLNIFMNLSSLPIGSNFISVSCRSFLSKAAKTKNFIVLDVSYLVYM